jgi:inhibitor of cysteine peptidase
MRKFLQSILFYAAVFLSASAFGQGFIQATMTNFNEIIHLSQEQVLEVKLPSTPSTGYAWFIKDNSKLSFISQIGESFESDDPNALDGASGNQITRFIPTGKGSCDLEMVYKRSWESDDQIMGNYKVQINCDGSYTGKYVATEETEPLIEQANANKTLALPAAFSWQSKCTPVKNQGSCGSCWSFATIGVFEAVINIWDKNIRDLSEQWLVDCDKNFNGCGGGSYAYSMFVNNGAVYESSLPYKAKNGTCASSYPYHEKVKSFGKIANSITSMKQALYDYGPMYVSICAGSTLSGYKGGIITKSDGTSTNHGVVLCGWDDNGGTNGHWIIKNSWGASYGEKGYFRIKYGLSAVGTKVAYVNYKGMIPHTPTGIAQITNTRLTVSPNPSFEGKFTITGLKEENKVEVYDVLGKMIYQSISKESSHQIDLSNLNKGVYFYKVIDVRTNTAVQGKLMLN